MADVQYTVERLDAAARSLEELATRDYLTGVYNRRAAEERFASDVERARCGGGTLSLALFDLDGLKSLNDERRHRAGDDCLIHFARVLERNLQAGDWISRWGGDEFVVGMWSTRDRHAVELVSGRIAQNPCQNPMVLPDGTKVRLTFSGGTCRWKPGDDTNGMLSRADSGPYKAKGGDTVLYIYKRGPRPPRPPPQRTSGLWPRTTAECVGANRSYQGQAHGQVGVVTRVNSPPNQRPLRARRTNRGVVGRPRQGCFVPLSTTHLEQDKRVSSGRRHRGTGVSTVPGVLLSFLDDSEGLIQRRVDNLRVNSVNANPGRPVRVEGESNPARHASHLLLIEPAADHDVGLESFHHLMQPLQLDGLHLHVGAEYLDGSGKRTLVGVERVLEGDYDLDLGSIFMT
jgi:diguanylate cyclase (GGDEF)-like protein